jgi:ADP-ribose pyrophosphatase YjhB (NUDIX family)
MTAEWVELVTATGQATGTVIERHADVLDPALFLPVVAVIVRNTAGDLAVHQRSWSTRTAAGNVDYVRGMVRAGEPVEVAASREVREELCIEITELALIHIDTRMNQRGRRGHMWLFTAHSHQFVQPGVPGEVKWAQWVPLRQLSRWRDTGLYSFMEDFFPDVERVLKQEQQPASAPAP